MLSQTINIVVNSLFEFLKLKIKSQEMITLMEETFAGRNFRGFAVICQNRESLFRKIFQNLSSAKVYSRENSSRFFNSETIFVFVLFRLIKGHSTFFTQANRDIP